MVAASAGADRCRRMPLDRKLLLVLCLGLLIRSVVGASLPITDPTEGRYSLIAQEMSASGDWVTPRVWVEGEQTPYLGKPPLFFWTTALSIRLLGPSEFAVRLPAMIATTILLALLFLVLKGSHGSSIAANAVAITATTGLVFLLSDSVIVDLHLMLFVAGAVLAHLSFVQAPDDRSRKWRSLLVFALLAGGFLTKGPVAIALFALPVGIWTALHGKWAALRAHKWMAGIVLFSAMVMPWFILAEIRNPGFLKYFFINENLLRFLARGYGDRYGIGHVLPRGSAVPIFVLGTLPWAPVAIWLVVRRRWKVLRSTLHDESSSLFFIGFLSIVLFWSLARQVLPTYILPAIPLFAAWLACELRQAEFPVRKLRTATEWTVAVWCLLLCAAIPVTTSRSTRHVLAETDHVLGARAISTEVVFAGRVPHSALFYAPDLITPRRPEAILDSLSRFRSADEGSLLIIRESEWEKLPRHALSDARLLVEVPGWKVVESAIGDRIARGGRVDSEKDPVDRTTQESSTEVDITVPFNPLPL